MKNKILKEINVEEIMEEIKKNPKENRRFKVFWNGKKIEVDLEYYDFEKEIDEIKEKYSNYQTLIISAKNRFNIDELMDLIKKNLTVKTYDCKLLIPYVNTEIAARVHRNTIVKSESFVDEGIILEVVMNEKEYNKFKDFILN